MTIEISREEELDDFFISLFKLQSKNEYIFRGISKNEEYSPKLFREFKKRKEDEQPFTDVWKYEEKLLEEFGRYSPQHLYSNITHIDWVATAQHFGIPTRLLDWTFNPFFGLFFSVFNNKNPGEDFYQLLVVNLSNHKYEEIVPTINETIYGRSSSSYPFLDQFRNFTDQISRDLGIPQQGDASTLKDIDNVELNKLDSQKSQDLENKGFVKEINDDSKGRDINKLYFCSANHSNPRIVAQEGLFQIPITYGYGEQKGWIKEDITNGCEEIYRIDKNLREDLITRLGNLNINLMRMFPDLSGICRYILESTSTLV